jgi:hypothetical protein
MREQHSLDIMATVGSRRWTFAQVVKAVPYLCSVIRSLRERCLEMQQAQRQLWLMDARPGRPNRQVLLRRPAAGWEVELAQKRFEETLDELTDLEVYCLDPVRGLALIPFRKREKPAWIFLDLFAPQPLGGWRFHADPVETVRPLAEIDQDRIMAMDVIFASHARPGNEPAPG